jgi:dolichol-phosphate mannosyltransferase
VTLVVIALAIAQAAGLLVLLHRLWPGRSRRPPVDCLASPITDTTVSVVVATLDEADRIAPCLSGLRDQREPVVEILVVDSRSTDGTRELVEQAALLDPRIRLLTDPPLPPNWVGKVWALEHGLRAARGEWILGIDADTEPRRGMVSGAIAAAREHGYSVVSFSPRFAGQSAAERLLQPAMLLTLVYRGGAAGAEVAPERLMANGQCFLARRDTLLSHGGYAPARRSFADDVTLARHLAMRGEPVGFLDGSELYLVRSYRSAREMWREWGRSLDLSGATHARQRWADVLLLVGVQALPLPTLIVLAIAGTPSSVAIMLLAAVNATLLGIRLLLLPLLAPSYERTGLAFWMSWLADPVAVARIVISSVRPARSWRGRTYDAGFV